jgi:hypothetical protein
MAGSVGCGTSGREAADRGSCSMDDCEAAVKTTVKRLMETARQRQRQHRCGRGGMQHEGSLRMPCPVRKGLEKGLCTPSHCTQVVSRCHRGCARTGSRTSSRTGPRAGSRAGSRTGCRTGSRTGPRTGSRTGSGTPCKGRVEDILRSLGQVRHQKAQKSWSSPPSGSPEVLVKSAIRKPRSLGQVRHQDAGGTTGCPLR